MKKKIILGGFLGLATLINAQAVWTGTNTTDPTYRNGWVGIGTNANPVTDLDIHAYAMEGGILVTQKAYGSSALHLNNTGAGTKKWSLLSTGSVDPSLGNVGNFVIRGTGFGPKFLINGSTGGTSIGGSLNPDMTLQVGDGAGTLHYPWWGSKPGMLIKFEQGTSDRGLLEIHDPQGLSRLAIQTLTNCSYIDNLDSKPISIQSHGGDVGIGYNLITPSAQLHVNTQNIIETGFRIDHNFTSPYSYAQMINVSNDLTKAFVIHKINGANLDKVFQVYGNGQTQIGSDAQSIAGPHWDAMLTVGGSNGKLVAKEIWVTLSNWADYVFSPEYKVPNLYDIEKYYLKNKHLPEIPSEKEVLEKGIDVAEMNKLLLKKIEEMTIILVKQQKEIDEIKKNK